MMQHPTYQIPAVTPEQQLPEIADEIANWKIGYLVKRQQGDASLASQNTSLAFDRRKRLLAHNNNNNNNNSALDEDTINNGIGGFVDTIRMNRARDQVHLSQFMHLNLPSSMHDRQVTNFEVRRMMQRTKRSKPSEFEDENNNSMNDENGNGHNNNNHDEEIDDEENKRKIRQEILFGRRATTSEANTKKNEKDSQNKNYPSTSPPVSIITKLSVMDPQVLHRKGKELTAMIQDASRSRAAKIPFSPASSTNVADFSQQEKKQQQQHRQHHHRHEKPSDIQVWYHRLGIDPPSATGEK